MIYTSYYGNHKNFPQNSPTIQISAYAPYNTAFFFDEVFPDYNTLVKPFKLGKITEDEYKKKYLEVLDSNKEKILKVAKAFDSSQFQGRVPIMLCYCKEGFCHRHILREWLNNNGIECKEL